MNNIDITNDIYSSDFPVLLCDCNLIVVGSNDAANHAFNDSVFFKNLGEKMNRRDRATLLSLIYCVTNGIERRTYHEIIATFGLKKYKIALVSLRYYFGKYFFEFYLFKSRCDLLSRSESRTIIHPSSAYKPQYETMESPESISRNIEKLNRVFQTDMLANLYAEAEDPYRNICSFDLISTVRKLTVDIAKRLDFIKGDFRFEPIGNETHVSFGTSFENFVNMYTMLMYLSSRISKDGKTNVYVKRGTEILFKLKAIPSDVLFGGEFAFCLLADMYPTYSVLINTMMYMCDLFGVGCFADVDASGNLTIEFSLTDNFGSEEFEVMPHKYSEEYDALLDNAIKLLGLLEQ